MISLENISFSYGGAGLFNDFNIGFERQKITCLLGSSGCGKTTILRLIAGLEVPEKGKVIIDEQLVSADGEVIVQPHLRKIGYIFQDLALWPHMTVCENVAFGPKEQGVEQYDSLVLEMLEFLGIADQAKKYPHQLSGGQQQLVAIARALVLKPSILLMDEPLSNLDVKLKRKILDLIARLRIDFNLTIIYVTHDHKEAFAIADKIAVMSHGKVEAYGSAEQIKASQNEYVRYFIEY